MPVRSVKVHKRDRKLKPVVIDERFYAHGVWLELLLDKDDGTFFAVWQNQEVWAESLAELKDEALRYVAAGMAVEFIPAIHVYMPIYHDFKTKQMTEADPEAQLSLVIRRVWLGARHDHGESLKPRNQVVECAWDVAPEDRPVKAGYTQHISIRGDYGKEPEPFKLPLKYGESQWLPYTDELYAALCSVKDRLKNLRVEFLRLLQSDVAVLPSTWAGGIALPAPKVEDGPA